MKETFLKIVQSFGILQLLRYIIQRFYFNFNIRCSVGNSRLSIEIDVKTRARQDFAMSSTLSQSLTGLWKTQQLTSREASKGLHSQHLKARNLLMIKPYSPTPTYTFEYKTNMFIKYTGSTKLKISTIKNRRHDPKGYNPPAVKGRLKIFHPE